MLKTYSQHMQKLLKITLCSVKFISVFLLVTLSTITFADTSKAQTLLSNMSNAVRTLNYQGRFMYVVGTDMSSFQIQHALIDGKEHERLVFLNQKQQEVVRIGHDIFCIHPGNYLLRQHEEVSTNPFSDKLANINNGIYDNYKVVLENDHMVAGRAAYKIMFKSKDANRYNHALWVDEESYLLLKADISDPTFGTLESFEYIQIEIGKEIPASVFIHKNYLQHSPKHFEPAKMPNAANETDKVNTEEKKNNQWQANWLPSGFYFSGQTQQVLKADDKNKTISKLDMLMYTDGIAAITVFIEAIDKVSRFSESSQKGAVSAYSHSVKIDKQNFMITVVGEVQLQTVERIAKGVYPAHSPQP